MQIVEFQKPIEFQTTLPRYGIYAVESLAMPSVCFAISDHQFGILSRWQGVKVPMSKAPELIERITNEQVKAEAKAIYEDVKDLGLSRIWC